MRALRLGLVFWVAHILRIPIDLDHAFFTNGMSLSKFASSAE